MEDFLISASTKLGLSALKAFTGPSSGTSALGAIAGAFDEDAGDFGEDFEADVEADDEEVVEEGGYDTGAADYTQQQEEVYEEEGGEGVNYTAGYDDGSYTDEYGVVYDAAGQPLNSYEGVTGEAAGYSEDYTYEPQEQEEAHHSSHSSHHGHKNRGLGLALGGAAVAGAAVLGGVALARRRGGGGRGAAGCGPIGRGRPQSFAGQGGVRPTLVHAATAPAGFRGGFGGRGRGRGRGVPASIGQPPCAQPTYTVPQGFIGPAPTDPGLPPPYTAVSAAPSLPGARLPVDAAQREQMSKRKLAALQQIRQKEKERIEAKKREEEMDRLKLQSPVKGNEQKTDIKPELPANTSPANTSNGPVNGGYQSSPLSPVKTPVSVNLVEMDAGFQPNNSPQTYNQQYGQNRWSTVSLPSNPVELPYTPQSPSQPQNTYQNGNQYNHQNNYQNSNQSYQNNHQTGNGNGSGSGNGNGIVHSNSWSQPSQPAAGPQRTLSMLQRFPSRKPLQQRPASMAIPPSQAQALQNTFQNTTPQGQQIFPHNAPPDPKTEKEELEQAGWKPPPLKVVRRRVFNSGEPDKPQEKVPENATVNLGGQETAAFIPPPPPPLPFQEPPSLPALPSENANSSASQSEASNMGLVSENSSQSPLSTTETVQNLHLPSRPSETVQGYTLSKPVETVQNLHLPSRPTETVQSLPPQRPTETSQFYPPNSVETAQSHPQRPTETAQQTYTPSTTETTQSYPPPSSTETVQSYPPSITETSQSYPPSASTETVYTPSKAPQEIPKGYFENFSPCVDIPGLTVRKSFPLQQSQNTEVTHQITHNQTQAHHGTTANQALGRVHPQFMTQETSTPTVHKTFSNFPVMNNGNTGNTYPHPPLPPSQQNLQGYIPNIAELNSYPRPPQTFSNPPHPQSNIGIQPVPSGIVEMPASTGFYNPHQNSNNNKGGFGMEGILAELPEIPAPTTTVKKDEDLNRREVKEEVGEYEMKANSWGFGWDRF